MKLSKQAPLIRAAIGPGELIGVTSVDKCVHQSRGPVGSKGGRAALTIFLGSKR
jgi:hypothetical protein